MKKVVLKLDLHDEKGKQKAMKAVSSLSGVDSISMDMKDKKLTVIGDVDPIDVVSKLRKQGGYIEILTVGPAKEEKKDGDKKDEGKKDEGGGGGGGGGGGNKKDEGGKKKESDQIADLVKAYQAYNPHMTTYYRVVSAEENPNSCVIC